jgi:hypothetical protein
MITAFCADELRWLPFEMSSVEDVERLNALLADGWRIEPIEIEGLPFLAFCGRRGDAPSFALRRTREHEEPRRLLLILQRTPGSGRTQRAVFVERSPLGIIELPGRRGGTRFVATFPVGDNAVVSIFEDRS